MAGMAAGVLAAIAGRIGLGVAQRIATPQPSFAEMLAAAQAARAADSPEASDSEAAIEELTDRLLTLPISREEAEKLAEELDAAIGRIRADADHPGFADRLDRVLAQFSARVKSRFTLCEADTARLDTVARSYARTALSTVSV